MVAFLGHYSFSTNDSVVNIQGLPAFSYTKLITMQTTEVLKAKTLRFTVSDVFGNANALNGGGPHTFYGLDNSSDIRFSFDYGITNHLMIGVGRSKQRELIDGNVKYKLLEQTSDNKIPVSLALYGNMAYSAQNNDLFYNGISSAISFTQTKTQRLSYVSQLIIARKFGDAFSLQVAPAFQHRNFVVGYVNQTNLAEESNNLFSLSAGLRARIYKNISLIADYTHVFSKYRTDNVAIPYYNPLSIGAEIVTGKHVFQLYFTNVSGVIENNYLPNTTDGWLKKGVKFGVTVSRAFSFQK